MNPLDLSFTQHAKLRGRSRHIPEGIADLIVEYGDPIKARDGAYKFALSRTSLRQIRRTYGRAVTDAIAGYRDAYVVVARGQVITVARSSKPLLH